MVGNIISIDKTNIDQEHICCAIGNDKKNKARAQTKKDWMKKRFDEGLVFKRLDDRGKIFIEYMPIEKAWKPVSGENYMVINCLWVSGKFKGNGISTRLLNECVEDARAQGMNGIAVVSSSKVKAFLTDKRFYLHHGFEVVDTAPPYFELLVLKFDKNAATPGFTDNAKKATHSNKQGFSFVYSNQCPFMEEYVGLLAAVSRGHNIPFKIEKLESCQDAQQSMSPFGTLGIYYNGKFVTHELMPEKKFEKLIDSLGAVGN
jgi:GNAT superfamily N-acetyltransferase